MTETPTAETFHDAWVGYGMTCGGTHAVGEGLCQNVTAVLAALARSESPSSGVRMGTVEQRPPVWIEDPAESPSPEGLRHRLLWPPHPGDVYSSSALCSCGDFQWDADSQGALFNATGDVLSDWTVHAVVVAKARAARLRSSADSGTEGT